MSFETPDHGRRLANVQSLRGFAALFIVISHLLVMEIKYSPDRLMPQITELLLSGVDLFFAISGFIMIYVIVGMGQGRKAFLEFLYARFTRIYPLYWLVSLIVLLIFMVRPDLVFTSIEKPPNLIKSFLLWPESRPPLLAVGWTLIHEMGFYLVISILLFFRRSLVLPFLLLWAICVFVVFKSGFYNTNAFLRILFSPLSFTFILGALAGLFYHKTGGKFGGVILLIGLILWAASLTMLARYGGHMIENHFGRFIHFGLPSALLVYGFAAWKVQLPKWSQVLGDWSYALYLTHVLTLSLLGRVWVKFARPGLIDNILAMAVFVIAAIAVSGIVYKYAEYPLLNLTKNGRRKWFNRRST